LQLKLLGKKRGNRLPKKKIEKPQREMTHRQLTHHQKQTRLQRIVFIAGIIVIVAIVAVIGTGFYMAKYKPLHQTVLKIGDTEYNMDYMISAMTSIIATYQSYGLTPNVSNVSSYASGAIQSIESGYLLVEGASKLDPPVTVSDDEVTKYINDNKLPKTKFTQDGVRRQLVVEKLQSGYFSDKVPASAEHRAVWAMLLESQVQADQVKARISKGENFPDIAAAISLDKSTKDKKGDLGWLPKGVLSSVLSDINPSNVTTLEDKIFSQDTAKNQLIALPDSTLTKSVGYWLIKVTEINGKTQAHVYTMLLGSLQEAEAIKTKLAAGGEGNDWATLAKANSQSPSAVTDGGDQSFKAKGTLGDVIDGAVFDKDGNVILLKDTVTGPLADTTQTTKGAVWLFEVNGIEQQTIIDANRTILIQAQLNAWFQQYSTDNKSRFADSFNPDLQVYAFNQALKR
jgi:parvulin-like peptidyl-prolyl isomerase